MSFNAAEFGERVRERRKALGLSQSAFGELVNASVNTVSDWERGTREPGDPGTVVQMARVLRTSVDYLLTGQEAPGVARIIDGLERLLDAARDIQRGDATAEAYLGQDMASSIGRHPIDPPADRVKPGDATGESKRA